MRKQGPHQPTSSLPFYDGVNMSIWSALGVAGDLVGGYISDKKEKQRRQEDWDRQDTQLQRLVEDARAAGFSPLAALGSNAAGQFGTPVGSTGSYMGDAVASAGKTLAGRRMEQAQITHMEKQNELLDSQIRNIDADTMAAISRTAIPTQAAVSEKNALLDLYVRARDPRTGQKGWIINPELADVEQASLAAAWHALNPFDDPAPEESPYPRARPGSVRPRAAPKIRVSPLPPAEYQPGY